MKLSERAASIRSNFNSYCKTHSSIDSRKFKLELLIENAIKEKEAYNYIVEYNDNIAIVRLQVTKYRFPVFRFDIDLRGEE